MVSNASDSSISLTCAFNFGLVNVNVYFEKLFNLFWKRVENIDQLT